MGQVTEVDTGTWWYDSNRSGSRRDSIPFETRDVNLSQSHFEKKDVMLESLFKCLLYCAIDQHVRCLNSLYYTLSLPA